jgi:hypothetical protein
MSRSYNYQMATVKDIAERFQDISNQAYSHLRTYYEAKGDSSMVLKLEQARRLSKIIKLTKEYDTLYGSASEIVE